MNSSTFYIIRTPTHSSRSRLVKLPIHLRTMMSSQTPRSADVTAITDTQLVALDTDAFARLSEEHPAVALKVMRNLSRALCLRLYAHNAD
jgi:CRP-like cAMP-binding protein